MSSRILAIDPGYDRCGVAVIETGDRNPVVLFSTCIVTNRTDEHAARLLQIFTELQTIISTWQPTSIALETLFFSLNKKTVIKVAEARGVVVLVAGIANIPLLELSPQIIKQSITGVGNANKTQVAKMIGLVAGVDTTKMLDDEIDAIALAYAAASESKFALRTLLHK